MPVTKGIRSKGCQGEEMFYDWMFNQGKNVVIQKKQCWNMKKAPEQKLEKTVRNNLVPSK